ncbi:MAG: F0F1 ATP synthase subunit epsilon [Thermodesulfobacteriota bacterium]
MAEKIHMEIVTPKGAAVKDDVDIVTAPGYAGDFGVLANHAPMLSTIKTGVLVYKKDGKEFAMMVSGGFCEISNNRITFLVENAEYGQEIDVDRAIRARERAEKRLAQAQLSQEKINRARAEAALQRAMARLRAAKNERH